MDKAHEVQKVEMVGSKMILHVDGQRYEINLTQCSERLAAANQQQRERFEISPSGYGIHWPDIDEDLSIDGLIGVKHVSPIAKSVN